MVITLRNLSFSYPRSAPALKGISLRIEADECVGIVGENGSGKSTLGCIIAGLFRPSDGELVVEANRAQRVVYTFQNPDYQIFKETVGSELRCALDLQGLDSASVIGRVNEISDLFGLTPYLEQSPLELPYGVRKLVVIAAAMASEPDVMVIDEGTVGLDRTGEERVDMAIEKLRQMGVTLVLISHDVEFVIRHCPRIVVLDRGAKQFDGDSRAFVKRILESRQEFLEIPTATKIATALGYEDRVFLTLSELVHRISHHQ